jgi:hypothetical protein
MRTLSEGSDLLPDFCIKDLPFRSPVHIAIEAICEQDDAPKPRASHHIFSGQT